MARVLSPAVRELAVRGDAHLAALALFIFPEGTFGLFTGRGTLTYNGHDYKGVGRFLQVPQLASVTGNQSIGATIALSNIPTSHLDDDFIDQMESFSYDNAPCIITFVVVDPETDTMVGPWMSERYEIDAIAYNDGAVSDNGEATSTIVVALETASREITNKTNAKSSDAEHRADFDPNDRSAEQLSTVERFQIEFGPTA